MKFLFLLILTLCLFSSCYKDIPTNLTTRIVKEDVKLWGQGDIENVFRPYFTDIVVKGFPEKVLEFKLNEQRMKQFNVKYDDVISGFNNAFKDSVHWLPTNDSNVLIMNADIYESNFTSINKFSEIYIKNSTGQTLFLNNICDVIFRMKECPIIYNDLDVFEVSGRYKGNSWRDDRKDLIEIMNKKKIRYFLTIKN